MTDPGDWIPILGIGLLCITTAGSIIGAYALGRSRRRPRAEIETPEASPGRLDRIEKLIEAMAVEVERIGEGQRFLVKTMNEKPLAPGKDVYRAPGRVITPH